MWTQSLWTVAHCGGGPVGSLTELFVVGLPIVVFIAILPAVMPWRSARNWRAAVPDARRRPQFQLLEIICVWFLFSPAIAMMAGRGGWLLDAFWVSDRSIHVLGVALAFYMALGAYAGWAYARYETQGRLPRPWRSCALMAIGSMVPPVMVAIACGVTAAAAALMGPAALLAAWVALLLGGVFWALSWRSSRSWPSARSVPATPPARSAPPARSVAPASPGVRLYEWEELGGRPQAEARGHGGGGAEQPSV